MRVAVIDVGSNTVRLVVADADGSMPLPVYTAKWPVHLAEHRDERGRLDEESVRRLAEAVAAAREAAEQWEAGKRFAIATSAVREAPNCDQVVETVRRDAGVDLQVLDGPDEAELTFLAVRRWMGWRAGSVVLLDIGGGSLEIAFGRARLPDLAVSLPLGAGAITRRHLPGKRPPRAGDLKAVRRHVRHELQDIAARVRWEDPHSAVGTSRILQQLARLCGAAPRREGPFVPRALTRSDLARAIERLAALPAPARAGLPGISRSRARQSLGGALVAHSAMKLMGLDSISICPWALREGVLMNHLEHARPGRTNGA